MSLVVLEYVPLEQAEWNRLSNHVVSANTIHTFKRRLDEFMGGRVNIDG